MFPMLDGIVHKVVKDTLEQLVGKDLYLRIRGDEVIPQVPITGSRWVKIWLIFIHWGAFTPRFS